MNPKTLVIELPIPAEAPLTPQLLKDLLSQQLKDSETMPKELTQDLWYQLGFENDWLLTDGIIEKVKEAVCRDCDERIHRP